VLVVAALSETNKKKGQKKNLWGPTGRGPPREKRGPRDGENERKFSPETAKKVQMEAGTVKITGPSVGKEGPGDYRKWGQKHWPRWQKTNLKILNPLTQTQTIQGDPEKTKGPKKESTPKIEVWTYSNFLGPVPKPFREKKKEGKSLKGE